MEALIPTGLTKAVGVCNMSIKKLTDVLSYAAIVPAINQVSCSHQQPFSTDYRIWPGNATASMN